jgi:predicted AAA+ superfamily ATPase
MSLHPVLAEKLSEAVMPLPNLTSTLRDARLPCVSGKVHAVIGMRRAGKTTFLRQLLAQRRVESPAEQSIYMSFDDDRLGELGLEQLGFLLEEYYRRYPALRGATQVHWFLDEIQLVSGWERFARRVLDTEKISLVVSGSSAKMLSREVHSSLRGRGMETIIRPFGFREFLRHRGEEPSKPPERLTAAERSQMEYRFREFLAQGGFPEVQDLPANLRLNLLQGYVDTVLFRDVVERHAITQVAALRWVVRHCLRNPAGRLSVHRLHQDLRSQGHAIGKDAVHAMLGHLIDAFLITSVSVATESERQRNSNPRKIYPADPGLIPAFVTNGRPHTGHALETIVFHELDRRDAEISYVKCGGDLEVDFLARFPDGHAELIQVCADLSDPATRERELRAMNVAAELHPQATLRLLVLDRDAMSGLKASRGLTIETINDWLLRQ